LALNERLILQNRILSFLEKKTKKNKDLKLKKEKGKGNQA
jgi:hypothetical protein